MEPQLLFVSQHAIRQRGFVQALFVQAARLNGKTLLLHETGVEDPAVNWYVSKRISAGLSEQMVPNNALPVGQTKHLLVSDTATELLRDQIERQLQNVYMLVLNPVAVKHGQEVVLETLAWLKAVRRAYPNMRMQFFPDNPDSAMGMEKPSIDHPDDIKPLLKAFPEERRILEFAAEIAPAQIVLATNFAL